jgi:Domain of unknown function (DUF1818)
MERVVKSGTGWRIGFDPNANEFQGLVGGSDWALELTTQELQDFQRLLLQVTGAMHDIAIELMDEETIRCEAESDLLWLEAVGYLNAYTVRLILQTGRRGEGLWSSDTIPDLVLATQSLTCF